MVKGTRADIAFLAAVPLTAAAAGLALAHRPTLSLGATLAIGSIAALILAPIEFLPVLACYATLLVPVVSLLAADNSAVGLTPLAGEGRLVLIVALVAALRLSLTREPVRLPRFLVSSVLVYVVVQVALVGVGALHGGDAGGLARELVRQTSYFAGLVIGAVAVACSRDHEARRRLETGIAVFTIVAAVLAILYWAWSTGYAPAPPGLGAAFEHALAGSRFNRDRAVFPFAMDSPNIAAVIYVMCAGFVIPGLMRSHGIARKALAGATGLFATVAVLTTQSRGGLVALMVMFGCATCGLVRGHRGTAIALVFAIAVVVVLGYREFPAARSLSLRTPTFQSRESIWKQAASQIDDHLLLGAGYHYSASAPFVETVERAPRSTANGGRAQSVHNQFLEAIVDGGVIGLAAFLLLIASLVRVAVRGSGQRRVHWGLAAALAALVASMFVGSSLDSAALAFLTFLFVGVVAIPPTRDAGLGYAVR